MHMDAGRSSRQESWPGSLTQTQIARSGARTWVGPEGAKHDIASFHANKQMSKQMA